MNELLVSTWCCNDKPSSHRPLLEVDDGFHLLIDDELVLFAAERHFQDDDTAGLLSRCRWASRCPDGEDRNTRRTTERT